MEMHLVVVRPFEGRSRGDVVSDPGQVSEILRGEHATSVVRVSPFEAGATATPVSTKEG